MLYLIFSVILRKKINDIIIVYQISILESIDLSP